MKYQIFKSMMNDIYETFNFYVGRIDEEALINRITDTVIYGYFWNYEDDMPTCNYKEMWCLIHNTVYHKLCDV